MWFYNKLDCAYILLYLLGYIYCTKPYFIMLLNCILNLNCILTYYKNMRSFFIILYKAVFIILYEYSFTILYDYILSCNKTIFYRITRQYFIILPN